MKKVIKLSILIFCLISLTACKEEKEPEKPDIIGNGSIVSGTIERHKFDGSPAPKIAVTETNQDEEDFKSPFDGDYIINKGNKKKIREDYTVGMDFKEGYYLLEVPNKNSGYYKIIRDGENYEKTFDNFYIVNLKKGDYIRIDNVIVSRLENPSTTVKEKLLSGVHEIGKDIDKSLYKTSENFDGYLIFSFSDKSQGPNIQIMERNKKYDLNEIAKDDSIVFVTKGYMKKDKPVKPEENTDNKTDEGVAKATETTTENENINPSEEKTTNSNINLEQKQETDKFEIGV